MEKPLSAAQRERLSYLENLLIWEGRARRAQVSEHFRITDNHFSRDIALYDELYPDNIVYDHRGKAYVPARRFSPRLSSTTATEYLGILEAHLRGVPDRLLPDVSGFVCAGVLPTPAAVIGEGELHALLRSIKLQQPISIHYQSLSDPAPAWRVVWPHALALPGIRWHFRAYDEGSNSFRDFVLARVLGVKAVHRDTLPRKLDVDWDEFEELRVIPNPAASETQAEVIARGYGMKLHDDQWQWRVSVRRCLVRYFARHYGLDGSDNSLKASPVILDERDKFEHLLFGSKGEYGQ